jgi:hypothetical protein
MRRTRMRLTNFRLLLVVAVSAILLHLAPDSLKSRVRERYARCMQLAASHTSLASEYRRNARGDSGMLRIAAWHEHVRGEFERAAQHPRSPLPRSHTFPPKKWVTPTAEVAAKRSGQPVGSESS